MTAARAKGGHATARPRLADALREEVEARRDEILGAYFDAMSDPDAEHDVKMRAVRAA